MVHCAVDCLPGDRRDVIGRSAVLTLLRIIRDNDPSGDVSYQQLSIKVACHGHRAGALIVCYSTADGRSEYLAFVKPSTRLNSPWQQAAGSSFLAAVAGPGSPRTAYTTALPAASKEAAILRNLIIRAGKGIHESIEDEQHYQRLRQRLLDDSRDIQLVGPVPYSHDLAQLNEAQDIACRQELASELAREIGSLFVLDLITGDYQDRMNTINGDWVNRGNLLVMQEPGKRPFLVAIDTDIAWDKIGHPTAPRAPIKFNFSEIKRTLQESEQDRATSAVDSLRRWDDPGAETAMKALAILFDLPEVPDTCNAGLQKGVSTAVAGLHPDFVRSHTDLLASWLADGVEGGGGGWPQSLLAPYKTGNFYPSMLAIAMRPMSPPGPLEAGEAFDDAADQ